jgi:hypothetical protein
MTVWRAIPRRQTPRTFSGVAGVISPTEATRALILLPLSGEASRLERAYDRDARIVALDVPDREAILRVLEDCREGLLELRATLLQERV